MKPNIITIISGTNRPNNNSSKIARFYSEYYESKGISSQVLSLEELPEDFAFNEQYGKRSEKMQRLIQQNIGESSRFIFVVPEYNGSFPGVLKTFIDCVEPSLFHNKKAAVVGLSAGRAGNLRGLDHITGVLHYLQMEVLSKKPKLSKVQNLLSEEGEVKDAATRDLLREHADKFLNY